MSRLGDVTTKLLNIFNVRLPRRITVQLGDLDLVFDAVGTVLGKKQRLQALGYYYEPITGPAAGNAATEAYTNCLAAWRAARETALASTFADDAALEADMQDRIRNFIVDGNVLPATGAELKIRLPGALTFNNSNDLGDGGSANGAPLPSVRFNDETAMWNAHTFLGHIPITFKVEKLQQGVWIPAPNEYVHIQLIAPFYDDTANELADVNAQRAAGQRPGIPPPAGAGINVGGAATTNGIKQFLTTAGNFSFSAADPQRYNAHQSRGGKRGLPLLTNIFDALPAAKFPGLNSPSASAHDSAARVQSNGTGDGGILFLPARMAGDRYRLRFFLDPNAGFPSAGTEKDAVVFETGRFTVWRHALWSNYFPKPAPNYPTLNSVRGVQHRLSILGYDPGPIDGIDGPLTQRAVRALQTNDPQNNVPPLPINGHWNNAATQAALDQTVTDYVSGGGIAYPSGFGPTLAPFQFPTATAQFQAMYFELEISAAITAATQQLTAAQYQDALQWAIGQAQGLQATYGLTTTRDVAAMFSTEFETPFLWDIRHPLQYNRTRGAAFPAAPAGGSGNFHKYWIDADLIIYSTQGLLELFLRYILGGASAAKPPTANLTRYSTPGLNLFAAMATSRLFSAPAEAGQVVPFNGPNSSSQASGIATSERAATVYGGVQYYIGWIYLGDGFTKNAMHEIGHTLYLRHQYTGNPVVTGGPPTWQHAGANFCEDHDSPAAVNNPIAMPAPVAYDRCLMGYLPCDGDYCGKCHLKLRGWDVSKLPV
jgi:peptidoglycan hydrolase-like protein with peptidoglycan-binding domain